MTGTLRSVLAAALVVGSASFALAGEACVPMADTVVPKSDRLPLLGNAAQQSIHQKTRGVEALDADYGPADVD